MNLKRVTEAMVQVGGGRGFLMPGPWSPWIVTAGHCLELEFLPASLSFEASHERTMMDCLGALGSSERPVAAELRFIDPISDIAVLAQPDNQELVDEAAAFDALTEGKPTLDPAEIGEQEHAWVLSLAGEWVQCACWHNGGGLWIKDADAPLEAGMSGSPMVNAKGQVVAVFLTSGGPPGEPTSSGGPQARIMHSLPRAFLR